MLDSMSATQFQEWRAFFALEPWGEERADWRAANIAAIMWNVHRSKPSHPVMKPKDFMLDQRTPSEKRRAEIWELKRQMLEDEMKAKARALNGGKSN